jgi:hypothetical protein
MLGAIDPLTLDADTQLACLEATQRLAAWVDAYQLDVLAAFMGGVPSVKEFIIDGSPQRIIDGRRDEVMAAMHWGEGMARSRISLARKLATELPGTATGLAAGTITTMHVRLIAESLDRVTNLAECDGTCNAKAPVDCTCAERRRAVFEARALRACTRRTLSESRAGLNRIVRSMDPAGAQVRRAQAMRRDAYVSIRHEVDGMSSLFARMRTEHALACFSAVDALARERQEQLNQTAAEHDSAPLGMLRAEALHDLVLTPRTSSDDAIDAARSAVRLDVVVDLPTLLGLESRDAELLGVGPVGADVVRDLIAQDPDATLRRLVTDPRSGHLLEVGAHRYAISKHLRDFIAARDGTCRHPGCSKPASGCDIDHAVPFDAGGESTPANLGALCRRHHQDKTHNRWSITDSETDGSCVIVSPTGRSYPRTANPVLPLLEHADGSASPDLAEWWALDDTERDRLRAWRQRGMDAEEARRRRTIAVHGCIHAHFEAELQQHGLSHPVRRGLRARWGDFERATDVGDAAQGSLADPDTPPF